jgi:hypothetical protein
MTTWQSGFSARLSNTTEIKNRRGNPSSTKNIQGEQK